MDGALLALVAPITLDERVGWLRRRVRPFIGGRVYERGADGQEHDWGEITVWDPPHRVEYLWHIFLAREKATKVGLTFTPAEQGTLVRLENTGFGIFDDGAPERIDRVQDARAGITRQFREAF
jgi:uncharacterized protein YndB with AHSA1/START domain